MKRFTTLAISLATFSTISLNAQDFVVLSIPDDILEHSIETENGAKNALMSVLENAAATDAEKTAAMQVYMQKADPKPGYGFDMSFLIPYNSVTADNKGQYTKERLAEYWHCDIEGVQPDASSNTLQVDSDTDNGTFMRIYSADKFKTEQSFNKFLVYQEADLSAGDYVLKIKAFTKGAINCSTLSAGEYNSATTISRSPMQDISLNFKMENPDKIKLGIKRNDAAGSLTHVCFNDMFLFKVSDIIEIKDNAVEPLNAAENATVQLSRTFKNDRYYPICLPFVIENWRDKFEDLLLWNNYTEGELKFATVSGTNTQARKPYLVKFKYDITEDNYIIFENVNIQSGNAGTWVKEAENMPKMVGNWAAGTIPSNCYYLDGDEWKLSDGTTPLTSFSAYIDATELTERPLTLKMNTGATTTVIETIQRDSEDSIISVHNLQGIFIRNAENMSEALDNLPSGIYIVNGKKIVKH